MGATLEFWFEFASTYSHPAAQRIEAAAQQSAVELQWRPFLLGPIFADQGWNDSPFNIYPAKGRYMWRDLERVCRSHGVSWKRPTTFPRNGLHAARAVLAAEGQPWQPELVRALYRANFVDDREIGEPAVVAAVVASLCPDPDPWLERASSPAVKQRLRKQTQRARDLGIFGAPTFSVAGELFWGDDRLEMALDAAAGS